MLAQHAQHYSQHVEGLHAIGWIVLLMGTTCTRAWPADPARGLLNPSGVFFFATDRSVMGRLEFRSLNGNKTSTPERLAE